MVYRLNKSKNTYYYIVWATQMSNSNQTYNSPTTIIYVNLYEQYRFT